MDRDCLVLLNAAAGGGRAGEATELLAARLRRHGLRPELVRLEPGEDAGPRVRAALARGVRRIVAGGGDGTVRRVAAAVAGSEATLGVLPLGTLNHFAKDLGLPRDVDQAIAVLAGDTLARVDVGEVNGHLFLNNSGIGLYPAMVREREARQREDGHGKWPAFVFACLAALRRFPFLDVEVEAGDARVRRRSAFAFVGNNAYDLSGLDLGRRPALDQGALSFHISRGTGRLGVLGFALRALLGRLEGARGLESLAAQSLCIRSRQRALDVSVDGEVLSLDTPLHYRIRPGALRVNVPAAAAAAHAPAAVRRVAAAGVTPSQPPAPSPAPGPDIPAPAPPAPPGPPTPVDPPVPTPVDPPVPAPRGGAPRSR